MESNFAIFHRIPATDVWYQMLGSWSEFDAAYNHLKSIGTIYTDLETLPSDAVYYIPRNGQYIIVNTSHTEYTIKKDQILGDVIVT